MFQSKDIQTRLQKIRPSSFDEEVIKGERFTFGENWRAFLSLVNEERIAEAELSLKTMLETDSLAGKTFLDIGSGSGLFSLAARRLGARVHSFDYDISSAWCTKELRRRYFPDDQAWSIEQGSVLDEKYLHSLGQFDIVYSWGVLHHTGNMWKSLEAIVPLVKPNCGKLCIAIYNDQGYKSRLWRVVKKTYCRLPRALRPFILIPVGIQIWGSMAFRDLLKLKPFESFKNYHGRGMSLSHDLIDWAGGYPFQVAKPEAIFDFYSLRGFTLCRLRTAGGSLACNEFVFKRHREYQQLEMSVHERAH